MAAPTKVQSTPHASGANTTSVSLIFSSNPVVGNGIVVPFLIYRTGGTTFTVTDNYGNTYISAYTGTGTATVNVFYCPKIVTTGASFTVTITWPAGSTYYEASAIEINNVGTGLIVDKTSSNVQVSTNAPSTGLTTALTNADVFILGIAVINNNQTSITVESVSPIWNQEFENLNYSSTVAGEANYRSLTSVAGTTQSCSWTISTSTTVNSVIIVFAPGSTATAEGRISQLPIEVVILDSALVSARLSQLPIEIVVLPSATIIRTTQLVTEIISLPTPAIQITQLAIEIISGGVIIVPTAEKTDFFVIVS